MTGDHEPQAAGDRIGHFPHEILSGPPRPFSQEQVDRVVSALPLLTRIVFLEVRDGRSYWQIAWKYRITPRRVQKEFANALVGLLRGYRAIDHED